jgi:hypothetical protein
MSNANTALRAAIFLSVVLSACQGHHSLGEPNPSDGGRTTDDEKVDATNERASTASETADAASADAGLETADAMGDQTAAAQNICAPFHIQYAGAGSGGPSDCPAIDCGCPEVDALPTASQYRGCVQSVDCSAACADGLWFICAISGCASDADCPGQECLGGLCSDPPPAPPPTCASDLECPFGKLCVTTHADGTRNCVETATNDRGPCDQDADCPAGHCLFSGSGVVVGICSTGAYGEVCFTDASCATGLQCKTDSVDPAGACSHASEHAPCARDSDCQGGVCLASSCSFGEVGDDCRKNADCKSGFCGSGVSCTNGEIDAFCAQDDQCASGRCATSAEISACTTGAPGSKCFVDRDCLNGLCRLEPDAAGTLQFGACD